MSTADSRGPVVGDAEMLLRFITSPDWWRETGPISAAFKSSPFSVNVESLTTIEESTRQLHSDLKRPNGGIVRFNCGASRKIGFDTRLEPDQGAPNNAAHAHVYFDGSKSQRMVMAKKLATLCETVLAPTFAPA